MAPYQTFHAAYPESNSRTDAYALWIILNHPLSSLWFHERLRVQKIRINVFSNFPLPKCWERNDIEKLAKKPKNLLRLTRKPFPDQVKIFKMLKDIDDHIYKMYGITNCERSRVEEWFAGEHRPGLKDLFLKKNMRRVAPSISHVTKFDYNEGIHTTTCETLELLPEEGRIRLAIDGLTIYPENEDPARDGILLKILPAVMPGWLLRERATGLIELTTWNANKIKKHPEKYIVDFSLMKNAYMGHEEIERELTAMLDQSVKEADID